MGFIKGIFGMKAGNVTRANQPSKTASAPVKNNCEKCVVPYNMPKAEGQIGNVTVSVAGGDITQIKADAYVVPEFDSCISEGGVGGAIYRSGAGKGMDAYGKYIAENGKLKMKDTVVADAGGGNSKYLIHTVTVGAKKEEAFEVARDSVFNALAAAQEKGIKSVAIPAIGTGIIGSLTNTESANAILSGVKKFADNGGKMDVCVVVYSTGAGFNDFANALNNKTYETSGVQEGTKDFDASVFASEMVQVLMNSPRIQRPQPKREEPEFVTALRELKDSKGKPFFTADDIYDFCSQGRKGYFEPIISKYEEKIFAVISNPEELDMMEKYGNRAYALWRQIQDPLQSTINAHPELFK